MFLQSIAKTCSNKIHPMLICCVKTILTDSVYICYWQHGSAVLTQIMTLLSTTFYFQGAQIKAKPVIN